MWGGETQEGSSVLASPFLPVVPPPPVAVFPAAEQPAPECEGDAGTPWDRGACLCGAASPLVGTCPQEGEEAAGLAPRWLPECAVGPAGV